MPPSRRPKKTPLSRIQRSRRTDEQIEDICALMAEEMDQNPEQKQLMLLRMHESIVYLINDSMLAGTAVVHA